MFRVRAAYLSCCLLWGSTWMVIKLGLRDLPPFLFAGTRMLLAAAVLRRGRGGHRPIVITFVQVLAGSLLLLALSAAVERGRAASFTPAAVGAIVYLAVLGTAVTYLCLFWLIPRVPMSAIGAIPLLDTTVAVTLGTLVLGETLGWSLLAGGALVLCGAALANQAPTESAPEAAPGAATSLPPNQASGT